MSNKTVYEDQEERKQKYAEEHFTECPHCGEPVLDSMRKCPHCGGELTPKGYQPLTDEKIKKIKIVTFSVGMVIAVTIVVLYLVFWKK